MARVEKGSRIKGLPVKLQLQQRDACTGSFPATIRIASDNRTGKYNLFFDDTKVIDYKYYTTSSFGIGGLNIGPMMPVSNSFTDLELTTSLYASGYAKSAISDNWLLTNNPGQNLTPFRDHQQFALDGGYITASSSFYLTGSNIIGFTQPLSAKTKIEIPLISKTSSFIAIVNGTGLRNNYPMGYWNFVSGTIEGIGTGKEWHTYCTSSLNYIQSLLHEQCIASVGGLFESTTINYSPLTSTNGQQISNFGFPYEAKYTATASQILPLSNYISEPFLLEKVILELSASFCVNMGFQGGTDVLDIIGILNFYLLNQRSPWTQESSEGFQNIQYKIAPATATTFSTGCFITGSIREVIGSLGYAFCGLGFLSDPYNNFLMNKYGTIDGYHICNTGSLYFNDKIYISGTINNPLMSEGQIPILLSNKSFGGTVENYILSKNENSSRNGTQFTSGRSWLSELSNAEKLSTSQDGFSYSGVTYAKKNNPYLLMPTDNLALAIQLPYDKDLYTNTLLGTSYFNSTGSKLEILPFEGRIILYGSTLKVGDKGDFVENHDTLNQLLTSNVIHEVIG